MDARDRIKALKDERATVWDKMQKILDDAEEKGSGLAGESLEAWTKGETDLDSLTAEIGAREKSLEIEGKFERVAEEKVETTDADGKRAKDKSYDEYNATFKRFMQHGVAELAPEERQLLQSRMDLPQEARAMQVATGAAGGFTVPEGFWARIAEVTKAYGGVERVANVVTTDSGNDLPWPTNDDTSNVGALLSEGVAVTQQDTTFGQRTLGAFVYTSKLVLISYQLLQDSAFDVEAFLARKLGERLGRIHNTHFTTGDGAGKPDGILTGVTVGKTSSSATVTSYDDHIDVVHSIDPSYRPSGGASFMFNDITLSELRKLRDDIGGAGLGRPLWEPSVLVGQPDRWLGYNYVVNQDMPNTATGQDAVIFGDFSVGYVLRRVRGVQLIRLGEKYAENLQVGFFAFDRVDGTVDDRNAYKSIRMA